MKTIVIFGGAGFIGAHFVRHWFEHHPDYRIVIFDALTYSGDLARLAEFFDPITHEGKNKRIKFIYGDIADAAAVSQAIREAKPEFVLNLAAETHVDRSIHVGAKAFIDTNVTGVFNILEAVKEYGCKKFVQVSTDEVYGELPLDKPSAKFTEESSYKPNVPYSATKAAGDVLCNAYHFTWGVPVVVTHASNNYGEWQYPEKLIPYSVHRLLKGETVPVYGDGMNVRDWMYVGDHVLALDLALRNGKPGAVYNIGASNEHSNKAIVQAIVSYVKTGSLKDYPDWMNHIEFVPDRPGHDRRYAIDASKIERELGWKPAVPRGKFLEKLAQTIEWYKQNDAWCRTVEQRTGVVNAHIDLWKKTMGTLSPNN